MSSQKSTRQGVDPETLQIARGLYETRVSIKRPPSSAQRGVYSGAKGPPPILTRKRRPFSAKARIDTEKVGEKVSAQANVLPTEDKPPWRPFSGHAALSRHRSSSLDRRRDSYESHHGQAEHVSEMDNMSIPDVYQNRQLPQSLVALQRWLSESIPKNWSSGYDPQTNFVFLPGDHDNLPHVPPDQGPDEVLAFTPVPTVKHYRPPKPRLKRFMEEEHRKPVQSDDDAAAISKRSQIKLYGKDGELIHEIYQGKRTSEIIRQEIEDLEQLLQGIGNPHGSSLVVRYQHDINRLKDMAKFTLDYYGISEETPRPLTPVAAVLQEDLLKYPARHDEIMASIQQRRDECVRELAEMEQELMTTT